MLNNSKIIVDPCELKKFNDEKKKYEFYFQKIKKKIKEKKGDKVTF